MSDDDVVIGCVRCDDASAVYPGSVVRSCVDCDADVWLAPSGVRLVDTSDAIVVCVPCIRARIEVDDAPKFRTVPGALDELRAWRRRN